MFSMSIRAHYIIIHLLLQVGGEMERGQNTIKRSVVWRVGEFPILYPTAFPLRFTCWFLWYIHSLLYPFSLSLSLWISSALFDIIYITVTINTSTAASVLSDNSRQFNGISPNMNNLARLRLGAALCPVNSLGYIEHYTPPYTTVCFFLSRKLLCGSYQSTLFLHFPGNKTSTFKSKMKNW